MLYRHLTNLHYDNAVPCRYATLAETKYSVAIPLAPNVEDVTVEPSEVKYVVTALQVIVKSPALLLRRLTVSPSENVEAGTVQPVVLVETTLPASVTTSVAADPVTDLRGMSLTLPKLSV